MSILKGASTELLASVHLDQTLLDKFLLADLVSHVTARVMASHTESAAQQVFRLPELLELILLSLPQRDLLLSQRVSNSFLQTTQGSVRLQRALFFAPDWNLEGRQFDPYASHNRPGRKPENNRLLLRAFPGCYPTVTLVILNDGTRSSNQDLDQEENGDREHWSWDVCISFPADRAPETKAAVMFPEASWRRMFLSQPPCTSLHLVRRWQRSPRPAVVREGGLTMGEFVNEATKERVHDEMDAVPATDEVQSTERCEGAESKAARSWHRSFISSDRDWHFEGNIKCSSMSLGDDWECEEV